MQQLFLSLTSTILSFQLLDFTGLSDFQMFKEVIPEKEKTAETTRDLAGLKEASVILDFNQIN